MLLDNLLKSIICDANMAKEKGFITVLVISTTKNIINPYLTPIRFIKNICIIGVVHNSSEDVGIISKAVNNIIDYYFVDVEKKLGPIRRDSIYDTRNFLHVVLNSVQAEKVLTIRTNELTTNQITLHVDEFYKENKNINIGIVGLGQIGCIISKRLLDSGINIQGLPRNFGTKENIMTSYMTAFKLDGVISNFEIVNSIEKLSISSDIIILCATSESIINSKNIDLFIDKRLVLDVGKYNISPDLDNLPSTFKWLDISPTLKSFILQTILLKNNNIIDKNVINFPQLIKGKFIAAGSLAQRDSIVIDTSFNTNSPIGEIINKKFRRFNFKEIISFL